MTSASAPDRRQIILGGAMLVAAAASVAWRPAGPPMPPAGALDRGVPARIGDYRHASAAGVVMPPQDELSTRIYGQYVARLYVAAGLPSIMLLIAYGAAQDYGLQIHRPESCYPASGFAIGPSHLTQILLAPERRIGAMSLTAYRPAAREQILYWTRIGDHFPTTIWSQRALIIRSLLGGRLPDGVLVRVSMLSDDPAAAKSALARFNAALIAAAAPEARIMLVGLER